MYTNTALTMD